MGRLQQNYIDDYFDKVQELVCDTENVSGIDIASKSQAAEIVMARQLVFYLMRCLIGTQVSLTALGRYYGKTHATVIYSLMVIDNRRDTDRYFRQRLIEYHHQIDKIRLNTSYLFGCMEELSLIELQHD